MFKFLSFLMMIPLLFCGHIFMNSARGEVTKVEVYDNGQIVQMSETECDELNKLLKDCFEDCRTTQSISIALEKDIEKDRENGIWLKFTFNKTCYTEKMSYSELLLKVDKGQETIDLIRGKNGRFSGRCINCALKGNLDQVYDYLSNLKKVEIATSEIIDDNISAEETFLDLAQAEQDFAEQTNVIELKSEQDVQTSELEFCDSDECFSEQKVDLTDEQNEENHEEHGVIDVA